MGWYKKDFGGDPRAFLENWVRLSTELLSASASLQRSCVVRYEELTEDRETCIRRMANITGIGEELFDRAVFAVRARGTETPPKNLDAADVAALAAPGVLRIARKLGYSRPDERRSNPAEVGASPPLHPVRLINPVAATLFGAVGAIARSFSATGNLLAKARHATRIVPPPQSGSTTS
jgi:hypothetical protein